MQYFMRFLILVWICSNANATNKSTIKTPDITKAKLEETAAKPDENQIRNKRQFYIPTTSPVFFDSQQQPTGGQFGFGNGQNIPIIGTLVTSLPILGNGQNLLGGLPGGLGNGLNGLTGGLTSTLGNLGSGLGNLGQLGNLGGLGNLGLLGGSAPSSTNAATCPASQKLACRCDPLTPVKPLGTRTGTHGGAIEILDQSVKRNMDGSTELIAELSNGLIMYQKSSNLQLKNIEGYYSLKVTEDRYLTIYYTINDLDYTVKADVNSAPPKTNFEIDNAQQNLLGSF